MYFGRPPTSAWNATIARLDRCLLHAVAIEDEELLGPLGGRPLGQALAVAHRWRAAAGAIFGVFGPDPQLLDERAVDQAFSEDRRDPGEVDRLEPPLLRLEQHLDVRPLQRLVDLDRQPAVGVAAQLAEDDRRRFFERVQRTELEVEQHRHRDGDDDGEADGEPGAAVVQQVAQRVRPGASRGCWLLRPFHGSSALYAQRRDSVYPAAARRPSSRSSLAGSHSVMRVFRARGSATR
jgi:hypothetical protein